MNAPKTPQLYWLVLAVVVGAGTYYFFNGRDDRTTGQRVGNAIDSFSETHSLDRASQQMKDQTPAQKLGNEIHDKTDENQNH